MPSSQVSQDWLLSHGSRWLHRLPFANQGGTEGGAESAEANSGGKRRHSIRMPRLDQAQRPSGRPALLGRSSRVNAQLAIYFHIAIIPPQMTGKTLVQTAFRPLLHSSLWMVFGLVSLLTVPASAELLE